MFYWYCGRWLELFIALEWSDRGREMTLSDIWHREHIAVSDWPLALDLQGQSSIRVKGPKARTVNTSQIAPRQGYQLSHSTGQDILVILKDSCSVLHIFFWLVDNIRLFTYYATQCQGQAKDKQGQAWTGRDKKGLGRDKKEETRASIAKPCLSLPVPACPFVSLSVPACHLSLCVPVSPCLSLAFPVCPGLSLYLYPLPGYPCLPTSVPVYPCPTMSVHVFPSCHRLSLYQLAIKACPNT